MSKRRLPKIEGELILHGLEDRVNVKRDKWGVPHIHAITEKDLFFAQGFIHAQDRLWQMELNRRTAKGTLSEVFGKIALDTDRLSRTLGFNRLGKQDLANLDKRVKDTLNSYVKGINAFINSMDTKLPLEFTLIRHRPEIWEVEDSMAISRMMIWQLSHAWFGEVIRSKLIQAVGEEHATALEFKYPKNNPIELPDGIEFNQYIDGKLKSVKGPFLKQNMGSNAWVISKERSTTGSPILANDMHLQISLPAIWYSNHLKSEQFNITGVSLPGVPLVLVGHNANIAWGATLSYIDCEDLFLEEFNDEDPTKYKYNGSWKKAEIIRELIDVKGELTHQEKIIITHHGPVISEFIEGQTHPFSLQSKSLQPVTSLNGWYKLNLAENWNDFVTAIKDIGAPSLNLMYADKENIGHYCTGRVPIRNKGDGRLPVPGWTDEYEWTSEIPFEKMPHAFNPERGYILSCNNKIVSNDYPYYLGENFMNGYRASQLENYFSENDKISKDISKKMQLDFTCLPAEKFISHLEEIEIDDPNPNVAKAFQILLNWDGVLTEDTVGGTLYEVTKFMAISILLEPHLGKDLSKIYMGRGFHPILLPYHEFYGHDTVVLLRLLEQDNDSWWISNAGGSKKLLKIAFVRAFEWLMDNYGLDINKWTWGRIHQITFEHALSIQKPLDRVFNLGPHPIGGDTDTPCQMAVYPDYPFAVKAWAPSWRQIIDLGDLSKSLFMYPPGQSGQLSSQHYDDLLGPWLSGEYNPQLWTRGQIENNLEGSLTLVPRFE